MSLSRVCMSKTIWFNLTDTFWPGRGGVFFSLANLNRKCVTQMSCIHSLLSGQVLSHNLACSGAFVLMMSVILAHNLRWL